MWTRVSFDLDYTPPIDADALWDYLTDRVIAGVEEARADRYRRAVHLPGGPGVLELRRDDDRISAAALLHSRADADTARRLLQRTVDADLAPRRVLDVLGAHPWLGPLVRSRPGLRAPTHPGWFEVTMRAVLAQQVSLRAARTHTARLVSAVGSPLPDGPETITHLFPTPEQVLTLADDDGTVLAMPAGRRRAVLCLARAAAEGLDLDDGRSADEAGRALQALPGIGPWTAQYVRMRALGDPDGFCGSDLVLRRTAARLGGGPLDPAGEEFRPWRTYAAHHLWREASLHRHNKERQ